MAVGMAGRRAFTPFLIMGTAVTSAAWFGAFEACFSFSKLLMSVPEKPDSTAQTAGVATVPCVIEHVDSELWQKKGAVDPEGLWLKLSRLLSMFSTRVSSVR